MGDFREVRFEAAYLMNGMAKWERGMCSIFGPLDICQWLFQVVYIFYVNLFFLLNVFFVLGGSDVDSYLLVLSWTHF